MAENFFSRLGSSLAHAWTAFKNRDPTDDFEYTPKYSNIGAGYGIRPDHKRLQSGNDRSIISAIFTRIAIDAAQTTIQHVRLDDMGRFKEVIDSGLNNCLTVEANIDQTANDFKVDIFLSLLDQGHIAIFPTKSPIDPTVSDSVKIDELRVGQVTEWFPEHVRVKGYDQNTGRIREVILPKRIVAIVQNPFYPVMNEPNSMFRRLSRKLSLLDNIDERTNSGKLNLLIQLPYMLKGEAREKQAEKRLKDLEAQLAHSKEGVAYIDQAEKVIQINKPIENDILDQVEYLTNILYSQFGLTKEVFEGTATNDVLTNYYSRTIEPLVTAVVEEMTRKFLTKTARSQHQTIYYFRDPFKFIPVTSIADIADKFTRNEILTANEMRQIVGIKASSDPTADELRNKNISQPNGAESPNPVAGDSNASAGEPSKEGQAQSQAGGIAEDEVPEELLEPTDLTLEEIEILEKHPESLDEEDKKLIQQEKRRLLNQNGRK